VGLASLSAFEHVLVLTMHHIVSDGWSLEIIARDVQLLYGGDASRLKDLPLQYADFAVWQRNAVSSGLFDAQLDYWKRTLGGELAPLGLPSVRPRPPLRSFRYRRERLDISESVARGLESMSRRLGATLFMTSLAAFKALLHALTGQTDIRVGTLSANRARPGQEDVLGLFVNTLVLRADLADDPPFRQLVARVRQATLEAFDNEEVPFEKVLDAIPPGRRSELFEVLFLFESERLPLNDIPGTLAGAAIPDPFPFEIQFSTFPWIFEVRGDGATLKVMLKYDADMYDGPWVHDVLLRYRAILEDCVADPDRRLSQLTGVS
jgi:hypothetical protein